MLCSFRVHRCLSHHRKASTGKGGSGISRSAGRFSVWKFQHGLARGVCLVEIHRVGGCVNNLHAVLSRASKHDVHPWCHHIYAFCCAPGPVFVPHIDNDDRRLSGVPMYLFFNDAPAVSTDGFAPLVGGSRVIRLAVAEMVWLKRLSSINFCSFAKNVSVFIASVIVFSDSADAEPELPIEILRR